MWEQDPDFKSQSCTLGPLVPTVKEKNEKILYSIYYYKILANYN